MSKAEQAILAALPPHLAAYLLEAAEADAQAKGGPVDVAGTLGEMLEHLREQEQEGSLAALPPVSALVH